MASLLTRLFPSRTRTVRNATPARNAARPVQSRLGVETLDDRCMPSVSAVLNGGVLSITADGYNTNSHVLQIGTKLSIYDNFQGTLPLQPDVRDVTKIVYKAGPNPDKMYNFNNYSDVDSDIYTGPGRGTATGGRGVNNFYAGTGTASNVGGSGTNFFFETPQISNDYFAGSGDNVLYRASEIGMLQIPNNVHPRSVLTVGLRDDAYKNPIALNGSGFDGADLDGEITSYLDATGKILTLCGPTGGGFRITGNWTDTRVPAGNGLFSHQFTANGTVQLETGIMVGTGNDRHNLSIPLNTLGQNIVIKTKPNALSSPVGSFDAMSWASSVPLTQGSGGPNAFSDMLAKVGVNYSTGGATWGLKLGSELKDTGLPLLQNVPYLYAAAASGASASFGDHISASTNGSSFAVAFDPADPAVFLKYNDYSVAVSLQGAIPYTPDLIPVGSQDPQIFGNLYAAGAVNLGEIPVALSGDMVLDLDANNDGTFVGVNAASIQSLLKGQANLSTQLGTTINDVKVGFNGGVTATTAAYGFNLSAEVAKGSAYFTPNHNGTRTLGFRVGTVNPFGGTVLEKFAPKYTVDIGGYLTRQTSNKIDWGFRAEAGQSSFAGFDSTSMVFEGNSTTNKVRVQVGMTGLLGSGQLSLGGSVSIATGEFDLTQSASFNIDAKIATMSVTESFHFGYHNKAFTASVHLRGKATAGAFYASVDGDVYLSANKGKVEVSGNGTATAGLGALSGSVGFGFNNSGFGVRILGKEISVNW